MSVLVVDEELKTKCRELRTFAHREENWYHVPSSDWIPGDRPEYVLSLPTGQRIVYTVTHAPEHAPRPFRHLTISVGSGRLPHPIFVWTIADLLGFTEAIMEGDTPVGPGNWIVGVDDKEGCVIVQEPLEDA